MSQARKAWAAHFLDKDEIYAGIILGQGDQPDHHLILLPGQAEDVTWAQAKAFAKKAGGELPTRREQALLYANCKDQFELRWYWSGEQHAADSYSAWSQNFTSGSQGHSRTTSQLRARAVRRVPIE